MQPLKQRFYDPQPGCDGSLQSCVRTDDLELVGDGTHLSSFQMLGNFSFGRNDYPRSVDLWHSILSDLQIPVSEIRVHPSRDDHRDLWQKLSYHVVPDESCMWSDGKIGGHCCEVFCGELELGNLVNPLGTCTDVGFGWERLHQVVEGKQRVDQTSLFRQDVSPLLSDHCRTVSLLIENGVEPGNRGRNYVCRRLLRRMLPQITGDESFDFDELLSRERELRQQSLSSGRRVWHRHRDKPPSFWWETFGILPEEIQFLQ